MPILRRVRYRIRQLVRGYRTRLTIEEIETIRSLLEDRELSLFVEMDRRDQRHSVELLRRLDAARSEAGKPSSALRRAALLHDVGKGRLPAWLRATAVLLNAVRPDLAGRIERERGRGARQALWRIRYHGSLGAIRLADLGVEPRVVELVRYHTAEERRVLPDQLADDADLARLIEADEVT